LLDTSTAILTHFRFPIACLFSALACAPAHSQQEFQCVVSNIDDIVNKSLFNEHVTSNSKLIQFETGQIEAQLGENLSATMSDGVLLKQGERTAEAKSARYDSETLALRLEGGVQYKDPSTQIKSDSAEFSHAAVRIRFEKAQFRLANGDARGVASALEINQQGLLELDDVSYTTCPLGSNDWFLKAGNINLDIVNGAGVAKNVKLMFQDVPILYAPYLSFPIGDARKSGILTPEFGSVGRSGRAISIPYYWNIAPNYDATFTPRLLSDRGLQVKSEFRYLTEHHDGALKFDYLPSDNLIDSDRHLLNITHKTQFKNGWHSIIDYRNTSDSRYFEDLGGNLSISSITHLNRSVQLNYYSEHWSVLGGFQEYQTVDEAVLPSDQPYRRLPQVRVNGSWPDQSFGLRYRFDGELVYFDRDVGVTGWRFDVAPQVELPIENQGWFITPGVILELTSYELNNTEPAQLQNPSRTLPIASLDTGITLERPIHSSRGWIQTLEPRILYVHIPHREQSNLPVFDTIVPDLNLVQLYRKNNFLGVDRIADTDQLSIGITSRILNISTGKEIVTATIGQALYLSEQEVSLPSQPTAFSKSSDYIAEFRFLLYEHLNFDIGHQWGTGDSGTTRSEARIQYRPQENKILNLSYRFRKELLEQGDMSWSWTIAKNWNFVGRYNFSFRDDEVLEQFFGIEYESCCWGLRLVTRRYISSRDGTRDSSFGLQLVFKGMASLGSKANKLLEHGILGYSRN